MNKLVGVILLLLSSSCSQLQVSNNPAKTIPKICLNADGKGRISMPQGKIVFSYSTVWDEENKMFRMEVQPPFQNSETLDIDYGNDHDHRFQGSLISLVIKKVGNNYQLKKKLIHVLDLYAWVIKARKIKKPSAQEKYINYCLEKGCFKSNSQNFNSYKEYNELKISYKKQDVSLKFLQETDDAVGKIDLTSSDKTKKKLQLELIQQSCRDKS